MAKIKKETDVEISNDTVVDELSVSEVVTVIEKKEPVQAKVADTELTKEERLLNYINSRDSDTVKVNDFLKSLYPVTRPLDPLVYLQQGESRALMGMLDRMQNDGVINIVNDSHKRLGDFYYEGDNPATKHHNILTVDIVVKK